MSSNRCLHSPGGIRGNTYETARDIPLTAKVPYKPSELPAMAKRPRNDRPWDWYARRGLYDSKTSRRQYHRLHSALLATGEGVGCKPHDALGSPSNRYATMTVR